jgi:hypothetical protein
MGGPTHGRWAQRERGELEKPSKINFEITGPRATFVRASFRREAFAAIVEGWRRWAVRGLQITDVCHILRRAGSAAEQAGFSEHGKNRLVMPAFAADRDPSREQGKQDDDGSGAGGGGGKDPLIAALIQKLPDTGTDWSADDRVMWLQMIAMAFQMAYGQKEAIKITKEAAH